MQVRVLPEAPDQFFKFCILQFAFCNQQRRAGRYKLAAPVSKTGSAFPRSEHYRRPPPTINQWRSHGRYAAPVYTRCDSHTLVKRVPRSARTEQHQGLFQAKKPGEQVSTGASRPHVTGLGKQALETITESTKRKEFHEAHSSISEPVASSPELSAEPPDAAPPGWKAKHRLPPGSPLRHQAATHHCPVAQKQSARLITGGRRSVTCRDYHLKQWMGGLMEWWTDDTRSPLCEASRCVSSIHLSDDPSIHFLPRVAETD